MPKIVKYTILQNTDPLVLEREVTAHLDAWKLHGSLVIGWCSERIGEVENKYPLYCQAMVLGVED